MDRRFSSLSFDEQDHQGCLWGILHVLHFHQWHNVKKMLPHRRIAARHGGGIKYSRLKRTVTEASEAAEFMNVEMDDPGMVEKMSVNSPTSKKCGKSRKKKLLAEGILKEEDHRSQPSSPSRFQRTESIHHLQPSHHNLPDEVREDTNNFDLHQHNANSPPSSTWGVFLPRPLGVPAASSSRCEVCDTIMSVKNLRNNHLNELGREFLDNALLQNNLDTATESLLTLKSVEGEQLLKDAALYESKEFLDALEILNGNKELLLKLLQDPNYVLLHHFQSLQASNAKRGLTKSVSFPAPDPASKHNKNSKLKPIQKGSRFFDEHTVNISKLGEGIPDVGQTSTGPTPVPLMELKKRGENRLVLNRFKNIRHKIRHAIKESRKEGHRISMDAIFHKIPYGRKVSKEPKREIIDKWREVVKDAVADGKTSTSSYESDFSVFSPDKVGLGRMRRAHSLSESLDRYSQLFGSNFSNEAKRNASDKLKLTNEDGCSSSSSAPKTMVRIISLPDLGSYYSVTSDVSADDLGSRTPTTIPMDNDATLPTITENKKQLDEFAGNVRQENSLEIDQSNPCDNDQIGLRLDSSEHGLSTLAEMGNDLQDLPSREDISISECGQEIGFTNNSNSQLPHPSPISVLESCFQEDVSSLVKSSIIEGSELGYLANLQDQSIMGTPSGVLSTADLEKVKVPLKHFDSDYGNLRVNKKDEADFNYVRDVLKLSGFSVNEYLGTWHSPEQPVDPSLFEEVEACSPLKSTCSGDEFVSNYDHQLLFDIINEVLLDIYERSFFYCPRPLSCNCHIRPLPMGYHVLEEVWTTISWYLSSQPELETSLDYVVARDLSRGDGWMNLQFESECVGLELEEMILDDLLDEIIHS